MTARSFEELGKLHNAELLLIAECEGHPDALEATRVIIGRQNAGQWLKSRSEADSIRNSAAAKAFVASLLVACASTASAMDSEDNAKAAAVADGVSTAVAIGSGAIETNPLINTSPIGLVGMTAVKYAVPYMVRDAEPATRKTALVGATGVWGGAAVNNLLILAGASTVALPVGLIAGLWFAMSTADKIDAEQAQVLALAKE